MRVRLGTVAITLALATSASAASFVNFETGQVRPLALSPDGTRLFAINTPDNRLELFDVGPGGIVHVGAVPVGLEPIAVAARTNDEVWVVNHLSDSVSIVDVSADPPRVVGTLNTCDEPRDIVFAGPGNARGFITAARRGQNCPVASDMTVQGTGRALVQVFDATNLALDTALGGTTIANVVLFGDTPRALARSADGNTVYAAIFHSGNQTTALNELTVCDGGIVSSPCGALLQFPGGLPPPTMNVDGVPAPEVGLIVKYDGTTDAWRDPIGRDWSAAVAFDLPDLDVFAIDAAAPVPVQTASFAHVGTVLFDLAVNPANGKVYATNTEARNEVRFEGPGLAFGSTTVQGHLHEARVTVLDGPSVLPRHLNKHIDYDVRPAPPGVKERSLATPVGMAISGDGTTLFVTAFGSSKLGVLDTAALEADTFVPDAADHVELSGGGPSGVVLDEAHDRAYVLTRFDNAISTVRLSTRTEEAHVPVYSPEPASVRAGRRVLYDAAFSSSNGEASCASCHVFGDLDDLAWDLGNPDDEVLNNPLPLRIGSLTAFPDFHPLKGPMTTQSLRGMANNGSMHWRGDRTGGNDPGGDVFDEDAAFKKFNPAFVGLLGRETEIPDADMQAFTDFILTVMYPPNPIRRLNGTFTSNQQLGRDLYFGRVTDVLFNCNGCHTLNPALGFFGTDGFGTFEGETQLFKVPHLRNAYTKVGMFGTAGPQIRGFGYLHDGSVPTIFNFLSASVFSLTNTEQRRLEQFMLAFDSNFAPVVGQQVTLDDVSPGSARLDLLITRATVNDECDIVVKGTLSGEARGGWLTPGGTFQLDRAGDAPITDADLRLLAAVPGQALTYTCVPPGSGERMGVDRDEDGVFDRDELDAGSNPADPDAIPATPVRATSLSIRDRGTSQRLAFAAALRRGIPSGVIAPAVGSLGDPTLGGATIELHGTTPGGAVVTWALPASGWTVSGTHADPRYRYADKRGTHGPITAVTLRNGQLKVRGVGPVVYSLAGAPQGPMSVTLRVGSRMGYCAVAPPKDPATATDTTVRFVGDRDTPAPFDCPPLP